MVLTAIHPRDRLVDELTEIGMSVAAFGHRIVGREVRLSFI